MKLYGIGKTRWNRPYWLLQELGVPFEPVIVDPRMGQNHSPEYLALNPHGKMPVLVDGEQVICESAAICLYLAEKYPEAGFIPSNLGERAEMYHWLFFCVAELEPHLQRMDCHQFLYPEEKRLVEDLELAREDFLRAARVLDSWLEDRDFLVGSRLTVADIVAVYTLVWGGWENLLETVPQIERYLHQLMQRPAFPEALKTAPTEH